MSLPADSSDPSVVLNITNNYRQIWCADYRMSLRVPFIVEESMNEIVNSVRVIGQPNERSLLVM